MFLYILAFSVESQAPGKLLADFQETARFFN